ncbi:hypothetical protein XH86_00650 [Bradyrhizobium guangdongense]|uniref:Uncharacterized protein n=1 Tax=Bradyrhizobium guangdongense TaxID=1325090 RepID=A0ABX6U7P2_9BRAD|nr:hypothetical protein X265_00650 [Bradyrhizobium guangdongense]QOZ57413.1 hypothetical protein XH86_00650 [Bradyrhizobium guangdongense]
MAVLPASWSCPAEAGHPVRRDLSIEPQQPRRTGSPAFAGDDTEWLAILHPISATAARMRAMSCGRDRR